MIALAAFVSFASLLLIAALLVELGCTRRWAARRRARRRGGYIAGGAYDLSGIREP